MKPHRVAARDVGEGHIGMVVAHSVRDATGTRFVVRKGDRVDRTHLESLAQLGGRELHLLELEPDELHETVAGQRLAAAVAGPGVGIRGPIESQYTLFAEHRGLLRVDAETLTAVNAVDGMSVLTRFDYQPLDAGDPIAGVKITPFAAPQTAIERVEAICRGREVLRVLPFQRKRVAALILERVDLRARDRFQQALERKLAWYGSDLVAVHEASGRTTYAELVRAVLRARPDLIMAAGASSLDPLEPLFAALDEVGARIVKHGVPVHPGSLFWIAYVGAVPLFGLSSCEMFSQKTILDLVLPRLFAGETISRDDLVRLGLGGMLGREMAFRFPAYGNGPSAAASE